MNRFMITFQSTLDALTSDRVIRERGYHSSFVSVRRAGDEDVPTTVALEVEAESDGELRDILTKHHVTPRDLQPISQEAAAAGPKATR